MNSGIGTSELIDLLISFIVLTIAFSLGSILSPASGISVAEVLIINSVAVGTGFILHELAHKFVAQRYGYWAEYKASPMGLIFTVALAAIAGIIFAAPGAVHIRKMGYQAPQSTSVYSPDDDRYWDSFDRHTGGEEGNISAAGPIVNLLLAAFFFALLLSGLLNTQLLVIAAFMAMRINLILAGFNMIPIDPLDGAKVLRSSAVKWVVIGVPSILLGLVAMFVPGLITSLF